ncbi:MAG: putative TonB protein [Myxococcales bacterium]|nr:putative TonB protein [Myxococcales bacterium]
MRLQLALVAAVLGATEARADDRAQVRMRLIEAINKRDTRTVESLAAFPLRAEKVRFASETCRKFWGVSVLVRTSDLSAFVECLASQKVTALTSAGDIKVNAIVGPGFPLGIAFNADDKVIALTSSSEPGSKPLRIEPSTFASHVTNFTREIAPSKDTQRTLDARGAKGVQAELSLCVDAEGATVAVATVADPALKSYEQDVADAAHGWKIEPFQLDGKPLLACATYIVGYPAAALDQLVQMTSGPVGVDSKLLEPLRIRGSKVIVPDDATKAKIAETDSKRVIGSFKLCVDEKGVPKDISVTKPSGYDAYDQKIMREMAKWAYKPYVVAGSAVRVCTAITFIYAME